MGGLDSAPIRLSMPGAPREQNASATALGVGGLGPSNGAVVIEETAPAWKIEVRPPAPIVSSVSPTQGRQVPLRAVLLGIAILALAAWGLVPSSNPIGAGGPVISGEQGWIDVVQ